ncbi:MAG: DUF5721 family protein [Lachnospiraceae bacterium]|nr:DUF5721 family protein [Lachnospiraceae bacterium]
MIAITIKSVKTFMNKMLLTDTFDNYYVSEVSITTFATFSIDGKLHHDFYDPGRAEELRSSGQEQILWKDIKAFCFSVIKGKHAPLAFKFVLQLPPQEVALLIARSSLSLIPEDVFGLFLNCQFTGETLTITTGSSLRIFTLDKSLDHAWDTMLQTFLTQQEIE